MGRATIGRMGWRSTTSVDVFLAEAGEFLRAEPARNTVILTFTEQLRRTAAGPGGADGPPLFGWWRPDSARTEIRGAFMHTPGFPAFLTSMSRQAAKALAETLAAARPRIPGVNGEAETAETFATRWRHLTGESATVRSRTRLFRLAQLVRPEPAPSGMARVAGQRDRKLLIEWFQAFALEVDNEAGGDYAALVDGRLSFGGITIWEADGAVVSIAGRSRVSAGMARIGPVYTPPALRGHGYAGAVTAAASQAARDAGATEVVLYTDLANPTSNALYQRLGYRPVHDRVTLHFPRGDTPLAPGSQPIPRSGPVGTG
jgi:predicted GNAT family acetyltransferase